MADKIKYVKHPVSPEEKKKLRQQGFKIVDAKFAPKGQKQAPQAKTEEK